MASDRAAEFTFSRPSVLYIPDQQRLPVTPTPFGETQVITDIDMDPSQLSQFRAIPFRGLKGLERIATIPQTLAIGESSAFAHSPSLIPEAMQWLVRSREGQVVKGSRGHMLLEPEELASHLSARYQPTSFVGRMLITALDDETIHCITRDREDPHYNGALEIPGGHRAVKNNRARDFSTPIQPVQEAVWREFGAEYLQIVPNPLLTKGVILTHLEREDGKAYFETTELVVMPFRLLNMIIEMRRITREELGLDTQNDWKRYKVQELLASGRSILPSVAFSLNRLLGRYIHEANVENDGKSENWKLYGEMMMFDRTFFETRGRKLVDIIREESAD